MTKNKFFLRNVVAIVTCLTATMFISCGGGNSNKQQEAATPETQTEQAATNGAVVQIVSLDVYNFDKERGTVRLEVEFDKPVSGLMLRNVTVSVGEVGLVQCGSGNTKFWRVDIEGLPNAAPQEVNISFKKDKYTFEPSARKVTLE